MDHESYCVLQLLTTRFFFIGYAKNFFYKIVTFLSILTFYYISEKFNHVKNGMQDNGKSGRKFFYANILIT